MKTLFTFNLHSIVDLITNSSSELFVFDAIHISEVKAIISAVYPNYLDDYNEVIGIKDIDKEDLKTFFDYHDYYEKNINSILGFDAMCKVNNWESDADYTEEEMNIIQHKFSSVYFLFSRDDNPDYDMQEKLFNICSKKYHLG